MQSDDEQIRELTNTWMTASSAGDVNTVLSLMTDDVVFLLPGRAPMCKAEFATALGAQPGQAVPKIDSKSEIQEIIVNGDWAFMWTKLRVVVTASSGASTRRAGHTLTVLKRQNGKWLLARDANLLTLES